MWQCSLCLWQMPPCSLIKLLSILVGSWPGSLAWGLHNKHCWFFFLTMSFYFLRQHLERRSHLFNVCVFVLLLLQMHLWTLARGALQNINRNGPQLKTPFSYQAEMKTETAKSFHCSLYSNRKGDRQITRTSNGHWTGLHRNVACVSFWEITLEWL